MLYRFLWIVLTLKVGIISPRYMPLLSISFSGCKPYALPFDSPDFRSQPEFVGEGDELTHFPRPSGALYVLFPSSPARAGPANSVQKRCGRWVSGLPAPSGQAARRNTGEPARALHFCGKKKIFCASTSCLVLLNPCMGG
jgi:hypothetical protein